MFYDVDSDVMKALRENGKAIVTVQSVQATVEVEKDIELQYLGSQFEPRFGVVKVINILPKGEQLDLEVEIVSWTDSLPGNAKAS